MGMTRSYPTSIHNLMCDEDPLSDASSTGDNYLGGASAPRHLCAMATALHESPPQVASSHSTHTPWITARRHSPTHRLTPMRFAPCPSKRLGWRTLLCSRILSQRGEPCRSRPAMCTHWVNRNIVNNACMQLPQVFCVGWNITAAAILFQALVEPRTRHRGTSTNRSVTWWSSLPSSKQRAPPCTTT